MRAPTVFIHQSIGDMLNYTFKSQVKPQRYGNRSSKSFDTLRQAGNLPGRRVAVHYAFMHATLYLRRGCLQSLLRLHSVALGDRGFDPLDEGPDAADTGSVDRSTLDSLTDTFLRRFMVSHRPFFIRFVIARLVRVSPPSRRVKPKA